MALVALGANYNDPIIEIYLAEITVGAVVAAVFEEAVTAKGVSMVATTDDKGVYWPSTAFVRVLQRV